MQLEAPLTLILSPLRAGRGEQERTRFGSLFGDLDTVPAKVPLSLCGRERVRVRPAKTFTCPVFPIHFGHDSRGYRLRRAPSGGGAQTYSRRRGSASHE